MNIKKIKVKNYRLLKEFELDLEKNLSLVIGKNNCGKTSLLSVLEKFISENGSNRFSFDDFNIDFKDELKDLVNNPAPFLEPFPFLGISLKLFIEYDEHTNLTNISRLMMDLDPDNKTVVLVYEYYIPEDNLKKLKSDFLEFDVRQKAKIAKKAASLVSASVDALAPIVVNKPSEAVSAAVDNPIINAVEAAPIAGLPTPEKTRQKDLSYFLKQNHKDYFKIRHKTVKFNIEDPELPFEDDSEFIDLKDLAEPVLLNKIINFKRISANRDVSNKDPDKALSDLSSQIYEKMEANEKEQTAIEDFKDALSDTDDQLDGIFSDLFKKVVEKVKRFGGVIHGESIIEIISTLQHKELLKGNTTVMYNHTDKISLPEHYNGLGYMNLISMIFQIEILIHEFKREKDEAPADINLLFIEEPEAHTHPQMQYVFIKNIKALLDGGITRNDGINRKLQTIISTHSSHIVSESKFDDIKYFKKTKNSVVAKNLKNLQSDYEIDSKEYQFLKQYLTISRAELFFADKAILIEGDTERILLPTVMRKIDLDEAKRIADEGSIDLDAPLLSQNISIVEVGAHSQVFEKFIDFLGIKSLIITDLDTVDADSKACEVSAGVSISNYAISFFFGASTLTDLKAFDLQSKVFTKNGTWVKDPEGNLCVVYQTLEKAYNARSFEDAFIHLNMDFIKDNIDDFNGIKNAANFNDTANNAYALADKCIKKKTHFALDILYNSNAEFSNWNIPQYIKDGLLWLKSN